MNTLAYHDYMASTPDANPVIFYGCNLRIFVISQCFCPWQAFQLSLMFVVKARSLPQSGSSERSITRVGSGLTGKHQTRLENLARDKHSSLLRNFINYGRKKFYSIGTRYKSTKHFSFVTKDCIKYVYSVQLALPAIVRLG